MYLHIYTRTCSLQALQSAERRVQELMALLAEQQEALVQAEARAAQLGNQSAAQVS